MIQWSTDYKILLSAPKKQCTRKHYHAAPVEGKYMLQDGQKSNKTFHFLYVQITQLNVTL